MKVSIDGGEPVQVLTGTTLAPAGSPDHKLMACYLTDPTTRATKLALLQFEDGAPLQLFDIPQPLLQGASSIHWTADGKR